MVIVSWWLKTHGGEGSNYTFLHSFYVAGTLLNALQVCIHLIQISEVGIIIRTHGGENRGLRKSSSLCVVTQLLNCGEDWRPVFFQGVLGHLLVWKANQGVAISGNLGTTNPITWQHVWSCGGAKDVVSVIGGFSLRRGVTLVSPGEITFTTCEDDQIF